MNPFEGYGISSQYGERWGVKHRGIDLVKSHKAPIHSFTNGKVIYSGQTKVGTGLGNYGIAVVVQDDSPRAALHLYAHLDSVSVAVGDMVRIGDQIGRQGNTGAVEPKPTPTNPTGGSHLHYEVRLESAPSYGFETETEPTTYLTNYLTWKEEEDVKEEVRKLNARVDLLQAQIDSLKALQKMENVPDWAKDAVQAAVDAGILAETGGSWDFYRVLTVLHRKGLI